MKYTIIGYNNTDGVIPRVVDSETKWSHSEAVATANAMTWFTGADYAVVYDDCSNEVYRFGD